MTAQTATGRETMTQQTDVETIRQTLVAQAEAQLAQYPQYRGHWDGWRVGRITRDVKTKLGVAFKRDDVVLYTDDRGARFVTAYSFRNRVDTSIARARLAPMR